MHRENLEALPRNANIVLIHGSWLGGWCWQDIEPALRAAGFRVHTPTMSGAGEKRHLAHPHIALQNWVDDIKQLIETQDLCDVVLVGHSFGGRVATGVVDQLPHRVREVIFLDSVLAPSGVSLLAQMPSEMAQSRTSDADTHGGFLPVPAPEQLGIFSPEMSARYLAHATPQPFGLNTSQLVYEGDIGRGRPVTYLAFTEPFHIGSEPSLAFARSQQGWVVKELAVGHCPMLTHPELLGSELLNVLGAGSASPGPVLNTAKLPPTTLRNPMQLDDTRGPANWLAADMQDQREWVIHLTAPQIAELDHALRSALAAGKTLETLTAHDFPLPSFAELVANVQDRLENGRGLAVLRGLPALDYNKDELRLMYWGLGLHFGTAVSQSSQGDLLGDVRDFGSDVNSATGRGYKSKQELGFHSDTSDVVVLMVLRTAKSGGVSKICSAIAIRNEIAKTRPDLLKVLYQPFYWSWKNQQAPGEAAYYSQPVYSQHNGKFSSRHIPPHILVAHEEFPELGPIPPVQVEAMKLVNSLANDPRFHFGMLFEPGDIQLLNNHVTMHSRTEFEDYPEEDRKRHLLRMWLSMSNTRTLSPLMAAIYRDQCGGAVRGGFPSRTGTHSFATVAAKD